MKLLTIISTLLTTFLPLNSAMSTYSHSDMVNNAGGILQAKGTIGGILICNGPNAFPACVYNVYQMETCYDLLEPFLRNASTFVLDEKEWFCYPYIMSCGKICTSPEGCTLGGVSSQYEHRFNLSAVGWDHYVSSFECHLGVAPAVP